MTNKLNRRQALTSLAAIAATSTLFSRSANADAVDAFYRTGEYTNCDMKILSKYWGKTTYDAKILAGQKILAGGNSVLKQVLTAARPVAKQAGVTCDYSEGDYNYNDAVRLAKHWGLKSPWDAKVKIGDSLFYGDNLWVKGELASIR